MTYIRVEAQLMKHELQKEDKSFWLMAWKFRRKQVQIDNIVNMALQEIVRITK